MTVADFEHMSIGMIFATIIEYNDMMRSADESDSCEVRIANDQDYLAF